MSTLSAGTRRALALTLAAAVLLPSPAPAAGRPAIPPPDDAAIVHVLGRLGYGARPGDVEAVRRKGLARYVEEQLHPERIADDPALARRLAALRTTALGTDELMKGYQIPRAARREALAKRAEMKEEPGEDAKRTLRRELARKYAGEMAGPPRRVVDELQQAKVLRAVYSPRQLDEVLVDFWLNHFNVFANKGQVKFLVAEYERDVVRKHAWGRFEDLLRATAESPAMLFYLDNARSADPDARGPRRQADANGRRRGLNENYAREIMELHTLGVDGGYTQADVTAVARCFAGWTIRGLRDDRPEFAFEPRLHVAADKTVLGQRIPGGGRDEGDRVIRLLAAHPSTARFVARKLAQRFIADDPPAALVDRAADTFRRTDGDIRAVVTAIVTSPEFSSPSARQAKVKTPLELVVSAVRASGAEVTDASELGKRIASMGMPLYLQQPPTGYRDTADAWVSTSGLVARLNFALDLAAGRLRGVTVDPASFVPKEALAARLLPAGLSDATRKTLAAESPAAEPTRVAGLLLGSPEFQRR
ncbi:MAG: DUF1800 domain-containing protein [Vicinamibacteria bacterium]